MKKSIESFIRQTGAIFTFTRHSLSSLISAGMDYAVFAFVYWMSENVFLSIFCSRLVSVSANYLLEKGFVFHSNRKVVYTLSQYLLLVVVSGTLAGYLIGWLTPLIGGRVILAKVIAESALFFINFLVQRFIIFRE